MILDSGLLFWATLYMLIGPTHAPLPEKMRRVV